MIREGQRRVGELKKVRDGQGVLQSKSKSWVGAGRAPDRFLGHPSHNPKIRPHSDLLISPSANLGCGDVFHFKVYVLWGFPSLPLALLSAQE